MYFISGKEEYYIGHVKDVLSRSYKKKSDNLIQAIRDVVDELAFSDDEQDYNVCSIELR